MIIRAYDEPDGAASAVEIPWERVSTVPEHIQGALTNRGMLYAEGVHLFPDTEGRATYVLIAAGERPTGGYSVEVQRVVQTAERTEVHYHVTAPPPGAMVTQAFTYPYALIRVSAPVTDVVGVRLDPADGVRSRLPSLPRTLEQPVTGP